MKSRDGLTWSTSTSSFANTWSTVVYGNGRFVAVSTSGTNDRAMVSVSGTDPQTPVQKSTGVEWSTSSIPISGGTWNAITYGNGTFVAVGSTAGKENQVLTSYDGITWTARSSALDASWVDVTYGNGLFVAVTSSVTTVGSSTIMTSPDGVTWTSRSAVPGNADAIWTSITYGSSTFVAVAKGSFLNYCNTNCIMSSTDGITWTKRTHPVQNHWTSVSYGGGIFVAVSRAPTLYCTSNCVMTSSDGVTWTARSVTGITDPEVSYVNGMHVIASKATTTFLYSTNGSTWLQGQSVFTNDGSGLINYSLYKMLYNNGLYITHYASTTGPTYIYTSNTSTSTWASTTLPVATDTRNDMAYGNGTFVYIGNNSFLRSNSGTFNYSENYKGLSLVEITDYRGSTVYGSVTNPQSDIL
jgi:hypothetical protein